MANVPNPSSASHSRVCPTFSNTFAHESTNELDRPALEIPINDLIWLLMIVIAAAVIKPVITGIEINCTTKPKLSSPSSRMIHPDRNDAKMAPAGPSWSTLCWTISAIMAVGAIVISFTLPKNAYTNEPIKFEYSPYCGSKLATTAYAMLCGIDVNPTVMPAIASDASFFSVYCGPHWRTGNRRMAFSRVQMPLNWRRIRGRMSGNCSR